MVLEGLSNQHMIKSWHTGHDPVLAACLQLRGDHCRVHTCLACMSSSVCMRPPSPPSRPQTAQDVVFPKFDEVKSEHVVPGMRALLQQLHKEIDALEANVTPTWEGLVEPLERISDRHQRTWGVVSHLKVSKRGGALHKHVGAGQRWRPFGMREGGCAGALCSMLRCSRA